MIIFIIYLTIIKCSCIYLCGYALHARTDMKVIKELAEDDAAYRSLTTSWFEHSPLKDMMSYISKNKFKLVITTDHGTVLVKPTKILGPKDLTTNLRYKQGKNMNTIKKKFLKSITLKMYFCLL